MRLHRLELTGFGPFRETQTVDFDAFADDGIFLIAGRTGAGKSSVLDGVSFGLYGGVPRYDGVEKRLRSDHCTPDEPTAVTVEFSASGHRWRVTRSPEYERPKQRGTGMTTEPHRAQLDELVEDQWIGRAARPVDVARELDEILGLSQQQFLQVILLAQNRFAEFLLAKNDERQRLLRRLFGTRTYEGYQAALEQRRKDAEHALSSAGDGVALLLGEVERLIAADELGDSGEAAADALDRDARGDRDGIAARLAAAGVGLQRAGYRVETLVRDRGAADDAHRAAETAHVAAKAMRDRQKHRARSRAALAQLEARDSQIAAHRDELARAVAAEMLRSSIEASSRAVTEAERTERGVSRAQHAWRAQLAGDERVDAGTLPRPERDDAETVDELTAVIDRLTGDLAVCASAETREQELAGIAHELAAGATRATEFEELVVRLDALRADLPARIAHLEAELAGAQSAAGARDAAVAHRDAVAARLAAARDAEQLAVTAREAEGAYLRASAAHDLTRASVTTLLQRRLAGHAGELAAALVDGESCVVCGSIDHPHPAPAGDDPVSDDEITVAERDRDAAAREESGAAAHAKDARDAHSSAVARAGGESVEALESAAAVAEAAVVAATHAAALRDRLGAEREGLILAEAEARQERERLVADLAALRERLAGLTADAEAARRTVDEARAGFASVSERVAHSRARRALAVDLSAALASAATARSVADRAQEDCDTRVEGSEFQDAIDAVDALRDAATRASLDNRIREHEIALRAERDRLRDLELELAGAPEELIDVTATSAALIESRERWSTAVDLAAHASQTAARLGDLVARAQSGHGAIADLAEDHAVISRLANTVAGRAPNTHRMTLESFVLAAELEEIVEAANLRLSDMSSGRYRLQHSDALAARGAASGLGLEIMDAHTGQPRPAQSLSGGETFLASLALALGLAEVVTARAGGVRLDTLFIDEGFGSLDDDTLELAMRTLDELRQGGRTVGLISHVAAMKDQLPAQLSVEATPQGPSIIRQDDLVRR